MQRNSLIKKISIFFLAITIFLMESQYVHMVYAANLRFYNYSTGSNVNYTGKQVIYTFNGRELPLSYPGIIMDGIALADYEELFVREIGLHADQSGNSIVFSNGTTELVLTLGSKTAWINGKAHSMSIAPVKLKFNDEIKYYVPTRFVAETFGYSYVWVSSINTVRITKTLSLMEKNKAFSYNGTLYSINYENQRILTDMPVIYYDGSVVVPAKQIFEASGCSYQEKENTILITKNELTLQMELNSKVACVNKKKIITGLAPIQITDVISKKTELYVALEVVTDLLGFELTYSDKERSYTINETELTGKNTLYPEVQNAIITQKAEEQVPQNVYYEWVAGENVSNEEKYLSRVVAYSLEDADVVELYGITRNDVNDFFDNGIVVFELKNVHTNMDTQYYSDYSAPHLNYTLLTALNSNTKLFFMIPPEDEWNIIEKEDYIQIYFGPSDLFIDDLNISCVSAESAQSPYPEDTLVIPLDKNIEISNISDEDDYLNQTFSIKIDGNHVDFYKKYPISNPYYYVAKTDIYYDINTNKTIISFKTKNICGYKYSLKSGYLSVTIAKPNEIYSKIIVLDAGHGGIDPGAVKGKICEKDLNFTILNTYTKELFKNSDIKVYFTRETDVKIDLYDRAAFASKVGADMFISLHMNANNSSSVNGTQVYYSTDNNETLENGLNSYKLAKALVNNLSNSLESKNRGASKEEFVVVKYNTVPAVLIELGFMTNAKELSNLTNVTYQKKAAETIYKTILEIYNSYLFR